MRNKFAMLAFCTLLLAVLACNLPVRAPTPAANDEISLTVTALTRLLQENTPGPARASTETAIRQMEDNATSGPLPTAPAEVRLVTGISAAYLSIPPVLDGRLDEWPQPGFLIASPVYGIENWRGVDDLSGEGMFGWDEDYLYLALHVTDDVYIQNATGTHIYKGDSIEILFDADLAGDFHDNNLSDDDSHLGMMAGIPSVGFSPQAYQWLPSHLEGERAEITLVAMSTSTGYDLEAVIPWKVLGVTPLAWQHYGFAISISDNDKEGTVLQQSMISNTPDRRVNKPTTWGDLVLTK
jgi:hypothetical protein